MAWRGTFEADHTGEFMGVAPTGKRVTLTGISTDRIHEAKFVERWDSADMLGFLQQLGVSRAPE